MVKCSKNIWGDHWIGFKLLNQCQELAMIKFLLNKLPINSKSSELLTVNEHVHMKAQLTSIEAWEQIIETLQSTISTNAHQSHVSLSLHTYILTLRPCSPNSKQVKTHSENNWNLKHPFNMMKQTKACKFKLECKHLKQF